MGNTITFSGTRDVSGNTRTEFKADLERIYTPGGIVLRGNRNFGDRIGSMYLDIQRVFLQGGVTYSANRQVSSPRAGQFVGDILRIFVPGGLTFRGSRNVTTNTRTEIRGDLFRIKNVTLNKFSKKAYITRNVVQPPGIPWLLDEVTTAAWCWKLTLRDGTVMGFTSHDVDIVLSGVTYLASSGFDPSAVDTSNDMSVDNLDLAGMLDNEIILESDLREGRYDYAKIEIFMCNYTNLKDVLLMIRRGYLGKVKYGQNGFSAEVRGLMEAYSQQSGTVCQKTCRATLGDNKCKVNLGTYTSTGQVTMINQDGSFQTNCVSANSYFAYGIITWTSGLNSGIPYEVKESYQTNGALDLFLPTTYGIAIGDTFTITAGCDRNATTCRSKFGNIVNFRGELYTPGNQYVASYTVSTANNTVSEGGDVRRGDYDWG